MRARQRVEDLREELRRLRQQHADVIRPDARLWWAVVILVAYGIAGVAVPLWVMSEGPASLHAVRWTFWPFAAGMMALLGYISPCTCSASPADADYEPQLPPPPASRIPGNKTRVSYPRTRDTPGIAGAAR